MVADIATKVPDQNSDVFTTDHSDVLLGGHLTLTQGLVTTFFFVVYQEYFYPSRTARLPVILSPEMAGQQTHFKLSQCCSNTQDLHTVRQMAVSLRFCSPKITLQNPTVTTCSCTSQDINKGDIHPLTVVAIHV